MRSDPLRTLHKRRRSAQTHRNVGTPERWLSLLGGGAAMAGSLRQRGIIGGLLAMLGGFLLFRGVSGHCPMYEQLRIRTNDADEHGLLGRNLIQVRRRMVVRLPRDVAYRYWRDLSNLPGAMRHIQAIQVNGNRSWWTVRTPFGRSMRWETQITQDSPNERLAWRSIAGSPVESMGEVRFRPHLEGGTEIDVSLSYQPPGGIAGRWLAELFSGLSERLVHRDLEHFKTFMESAAASGRVDASVS